VAWQKLHPPGKGISATLPVIRLAHYSSSNSFEITRHKLNIVEHAEQELVDRHFAPFHVCFLGLFFATVTKKNGLECFSRFRTGSTQNSDPVCVVLNHTAATVASYFRTWISGFVYLKYDGHKCQTTSPSLIGNRKLGNVP
jgi:hypothetical protein